MVDPASEHVTADRFSMAEKIYGYLFFRGRHVLGRFVVAQFIELYGQVTLVMRISTGMYWNDFGNVDAHFCKSIYLSRIIRHNAQARDIEVIQHGFANFIPSAIWLEAQLHIGLCRIGPGILQRIGFDLV